MIPNHIKLTIDTVASFATWSVLNLSYDFLVGFWKHFDIRPAHLWQSWRGAPLSLAQDQNPLPQLDVNRPIPVTTSPTAFHSHHTGSVWQSALQFVGRFYHFNRLEREKGCLS